MDLWRTRGHSWAENTFLPHPRASRAKSRCQPSLDQILRTLGRAHLMHTVRTPALLKTLKSHLISPPTMMHGHEYQALFPHSGYCFNNSKRDIQRLVKASTSGENFTSSELSLGQLSWKERIKCHQLSCEYRRRPVTPGFRGSKTRAWYNQQVW
jgi:hypothetical protein